MMAYDPSEVVRAYTENAEIEHQAEISPSLRTEIPREYIKRYLQPTDTVLDAGGGVGVNAVMMAERCASVTLLDLTPRMIELAQERIRRSGLQDRIHVMRGDICRMEALADGQFSFVVCVGDALSYVLDQREQALSELVRVARKGAFLILGTDSKYGFLRLRLAQGKIEEAWEIVRTSRTTCGMGPRTYLYTVSEMQSDLERHGCELIEAASTPSISDTIDVSQYADIQKWEQLKRLEMEICTTPELLGVGLHLLFVAQKR